MSQPARTVLAVIDMQNIFAQPDSQWASPGFDGIVAPVVALVEAFAPSVVFTRFIAPATPEGAWRAYYEDWPFALQPPQAPAWQVVEALAAQAAAVAGTDGAGGMIDRPTFSKWGPELADLVGPGDRLVVCGVSTDCCVISTVLPAADAGVEVIVVAEACAGVDDDCHRKALDVMELFGPLVRIVGLSQALALAPGRTG